VLIPSYIFETQVIQECCALGFKPYSQEIGENIWDSWTFSKQTQSWLWSKVFHCYIIRRQSAPLKTVLWYYSSSHAR